MQLQWLIAPLVGSVIGYITNDIAVRMLFRPHSEKRLFGKKIPFTPGLIPKERSRLASAIRSVLDQELLTPEVLEEALLSPEIVNRLKSAADGALSSFFTEKRTLREFLEQFFSPDALRETEKNLLSHANGYFMDKLLSSGIEQVIAAAILSEVHRKLSASAGGLLALFWDEKRSASLEEKLAASVKEQIALRGPEMLASFLSDIAHQGLDTPIEALASQFEPRKDEIKDFVLANYAQIIHSALPKALQMLDLGAIVEKKLNSLNVAQLESLILKIMKKELRAIVWLGALLGALMGLVNLLLL